MTDSPTVRITARRREAWKPWFGDRHQFERLCRLCGECFESRQHRFSDAEVAEDARQIDLLKQGAGLAERSRLAAAPKMTLDDGHKSFTGSISDVLPLVDFPHTSEIEIRAEVPYQADVTVKAELKLSCHPRKGILIEVSGNDEAWVVASFSRLSEEAARRRPWWASMSTAAFETSMMGLLGLFITALIYLTFTVVPNSFGAPLRFSLVLILSGLLNLLAYQVLKRMPVFEIYAEGGKSRREVLLFWLAVTAPAVFGFGILINLLTN